MVLTYIAPSPTFRHKNRDADQRRMENMNRDYSHIPMPLVDEGEYCDICEFIIDEFGHEQEPHLWHRLKEVEEQNAHLVRENEWQAEMIANLQETVFKS